MSSSSPIPVVNVDVDKFLTYSVAGLLYVLGVMIMTPIAFIDGYVFQCYWHWFVLPVFPAMRALTLVEASGLYILVQFAATQTRSTESGHIKGSSPLADLEKVALFLLIGYFLHLLM